jgi:hypothetical protein
MSFILSSSSSSSSHSGQHCYCIFRGCRLQISAHRSSERQRKRVILRSCQLVTVGVSSPADGRSVRRAGEVTVMAELCYSARTCHGHTLSTTDKTWGSNSGLCGEKPVSKRPHHSRTPRSSKPADFSRLSSDPPDRFRPCLFTDIFPVVALKCNLSKASLHRT